jgi:acyl carrier protein
MVVAVEAEQDAGYDVETAATLQQQIVDAMAVLVRRVLPDDVEVAEDSLLMEHLGLSSSLVLELLLELEEKFDIQIDVEGMDEDELRTVGQLAGYIAHHSTPVR